MKYELRSLRQRLKMSQKELADKLLVSPGCVSGWETGKTEIPENRIDEIAKVLNVDSSFIKTLNGKNVLLNDVNDSILRKGQDDILSYVLKFSDHSIVGLTLTLASFIKEASLFSPMNRRDELLIKLKEVIEQQTLMLKNPEV